MFDLSRGLQDTRQYAVDGLKELLGHPTKYLTKAGKSFAQDVGTLAKDYWDAGLAVASGIALSPAGNQVYGSLIGDSYTSLGFSQKLQIGSFGAFISLVGAGVRDSGSIRNYLSGLLSTDNNSHGHSGARGFCAGVSSFLIGVDSSAQGSIDEEILAKLLEMLFVAGFVKVEQERRDMSKVSSGLPI